MFLFREPVDKIAESLHNCSTSDEVQLTDDENEEENVNYRDKEKKTKSHEKSQA